MASGRGARVRDADGRSYIDYVMSYGPHLFGHGPPFLRRALDRACRRGTSFGAPTELEVRLAERVVKLVPSIEMVRFVSSGTEATMSAVRLARGATGRKRILKTDGGYHGHADGFLVAAGSGVATLGIAGSPGVPEEIAALTTVVPYNDAAALEAALEGLSRRRGGIHRRARRGEHGPGSAATRLPRGRARADATSRGAPDLRRGHLGIPARGRRRPGDLSA